MGTIEHVINDDPCMNVLQHYLYGNHLTMETNRNFLFVLKQVKRMLQTLISIGTDSGT